MGLFDFAKNSVNKTKQEVTDAYHEIMDLNYSSLASEKEKNEVCFERGLDKFEEASKKGQTSKMTGYMKALQDLYRANGIHDDVYFLHNQWDRLHHYKCYNALKIFNQMLERDGYVERDSAGRYVWRG